MCSPPDVYQNHSGQLSRAHGLDACTAHGNGRVFRRASCVVRRPGSFQAVDEANTHAYRRTDRQTDKGVGEDEKGEELTQELGSFWMEA